jgi:hypothetical protein
MALFKRLVEQDRPALTFTLDGQPASGLQGDTLLTAVLTRSEHLRGSDFSAEPRAGFCMMRACSTLLEQGQDVTRDPGRQL